MYITNDNVCNSLSTSLSRNYNQSTYMYNLNDSYLHKDVMWLPLLYFLGLTNYIWVTTTHKHLTDNRASNWHSYKQRNEIIKSLTWTPILNTKQYNTIYILLSMELTSNNGC